MEKLALLMNLRFLCGLVALWLTIATSGAAPVIFKAEMFSFEPPEGWKAVTDQVMQPGLLAAYQSPDETAVLLVRFDARPGLGRSFNEQAISRFERDFIKRGGGPRLTGRFREIDGMKVYERRGSNLLEDIPVKTLTFVAANTQGLIALEGISSGEVNEANEVILKSLESLKLPDLKAFADLDRVSQMFKEPGKAGEIMSQILKSEQGAAFRKVLFIALAVIVGWFLLIGFASYKLAIKGEH